MKDGRDAGSAPGSCLLKTQVMTFSFRLRRVFALLPEFVSPPEASRLLVWRNFPPTDRSSDSLQWSRGSGTGT